VLLISAADKFLALINPNAIANLFLNVIPGAAQSLAEFPLKRAQHKA
jgi:hypothetical protein